MAARETDPVPLSVEPAARTVPVAVVRPMAREIALAPEAVEPAMPGEEAPLSVQLNMDAG